MEQLMTLSLSTLSIPFAQSKSAHRHVLAEKCSSPALVTILDRSGPAKVVCSKVGNQCLKARQVVVPLLPAIFIILIIPVLRIVLVLLTLAIYLHSYINHSSIISFCLSSS